MNWSQNNEIQIFQEYLKIRTDHPDVNYSKYKNLVYQFQSGFDWKY